MYPHEDPDSFDENETERHSSEFFPPDAHLPQDFDPATEWDSDRALEAVKMERELNPHFDNVTMTRQILEQSGPQAAMAIVNIAMNGSTDASRLRAATYITDRLIDAPDKNDKNYWESVLADAVRDVEIHANNNSSS